MKRLLVTGGSSYLGRHFVPLAQKSFEVKYTYFQHEPSNLLGGHRLDLKDETAVTALVHQFKPHTILHLAGSNRPADMAAVIRRGTQNVVNAAKATESRLIHLSTDSIFDGKNPPYREDALPTPVNEYGRAKADAEGVVRTLPNHVIVRTSLIYSLQEMDHGTAWMSRALKEKKPVTLFNNQIRNPVWIYTLCQACIELIKNDYVGIINVAGNQVLTRAAFAVRMLDYWQIKERDTLVIGKSPENRWPLDCRLDLSHAQRLLNTPLLGVDDVIPQIDNPKP